MEKIIISSEYVGQRLDKVIASLLPDKTRSNIMKLIEDEKILVNNLPFKASQKAKLNDEITILDIEPVSLDLEAQNLKRKSIFDMYQI